MNTSMKRQFWKSIATDEHYMEATFWWDKRVKLDPNSPHNPHSGGEVPKAALLRLLVEKADQASQLRTAADEREFLLMNQIEAMEAAATKAVETMRVADARIAELLWNVKDLESAAEVRASADKDVKDFEFGGVILQSANAARGTGNKRGKAKVGVERSGLPTCNTVQLRYDQVDLFKKMRWRTVSDIKKAIANLALANGCDNTKKLQTVSMRQALDAVFVFSMVDAPWKRGCLKSFLLYMGSKMFEDTGAKGRRHWVCIKLWPGRFATAAEAHKHTGCMSKAGKFMTSVGKLQALFENCEANRVA